MRTPEYEAAMAAILALAETMRAHLGVPSKVIAANLQTSIQGLQDAGKGEAADALSSVMRGVVKAWAQLDVMAASRGQPPN